MPKWAEDTLTDQQKKWFASVREGLVRETGRDLEAWAEIARACPETAHRARLRWLKAHHGLGQNRGSLVLSMAFPSGEPVRDGDEDPLWADPAARAIFDAVHAAATALEGVVVGRRKGFTAFSRRYQFAAARPVKAGGVRLGVAVPAEADPRLSPPASEGWSERLGGVMVLADVEAVDAGVTALLQHAWSRS